jgi:hypothetical protein
MNSEGTIGTEVEEWIDREELPVSAVLKVERRGDAWYGCTEEEIEDCREFIRCHLRKEFEVLLQIPNQPVECDFWFTSDQEFLESAFNTWDYQRGWMPFNKYAYRIRKIMEQVRELAIFHSSVSQAEGRANIQRRYENLLEKKFREQLQELVERYRLTKDEEKRFEIRRKVARLNRHILECKKVWERYSLWEDLFSLQNWSRLVRESNLPDPQERSRR